MSNGHLSSDTQILLADGTYKSITQIVLGDMILNMHLKPVRVSQIDKKTDEIPMCAIWYPNWYTPVHYARDLQILTIDETISGEETIWRKVGELSRDDDFCTAGEIYSYRPQEFDIREITPSFEIGYIFGLYAGYGNLDKDKIEFCFGPNSELVSELSALLRKSFDAEISVEEDESCFKVRVVSKKLHDILSEFGSKINRDIPRKYWSMHTDYVHGLFDGLTEFDPELNTSRYVTASEKMAQAFTWICSVLGLPFENNTLIVNSHPIQIYSLFIKHTEPSSGPTGYIQEEGGVRMTDEDVPQQAWDLCVDCPTNSFIANNSIVRMVPGKPLSD